jgi:ankyrin repeat protein
VPKQLRSLDQLIIQEPCKADWQSMSGNDRVRFCEHCNLRVTDLSSMTRHEAMRLVARSQGRLCVRLAQTSGGLIVAHKDRIYGIGRRVSQLAAGVFTATLSVTTATAQSGLQIDRARPTSATVNPGSPRAKGVRLSGVITDPNGAVVAGAKVTLVNGKTQLAFTCTTDDDGAYKFSLLEAGRYSLSVEATSFAQTEKPEFDLKAEGEETIDLTLQIPSLNAEVEINAGTTRVVTMTMGAVGFQEPEEPLVKAAWKNDVIEVARLALSGSDANVVDKATNMSGLDYATENGNRDMISVLLSAGAGPNAANTRGETPLMHLRENATVDVVRDLLSAGAQVNARDESGSTALISFAAFGSFEAVKQLLDAGAKIDAKDDNGNTVLMSAAQNEDTRLLRQLIKAGLNLNAKNSDHVSALMIAARSGKADSLKALIEAGASLGLQTEDLSDALMLAMDTEAPSLVRILLDAGADARAKDSAGKTALMFAAQHGNLAMVQALIDAGADLNATNDDGWTAVMFADEAEVVRVLINAGADLTIKNKDGETALGMARKYEQTEVVKLLESRGAPL